jgi:hypothetical protein
VSRLSASLKRLHAWLKARGEVVGLIGLLTGTALGIGIPLWQTYWVDTPRLSVEIYAIDRLVSSDARIPPDDDALAVLRRNVPTSIEDLMGEQTSTSLFSSSIDAARTIRRNGYTPKEADDLLSRAKQELRALPDRVDERQRQLRDAESLSPDRLTVADVNRLNGPIGNEFRGNLSVIANPTPEGQAERLKAVEHFKREYSKRLESVQKRLADLQAQLPAAERRLQDLKKDLEAQKGYFQITAILSNSGKKSISIRQSALCRVYIGKGNYVDLKLNLREYQTTAEISPNGTRIATFNSELVETFDPADRLLVSTYWGQSVHGILFAEDITGTIHSSNRIAFAKGLYQKVIFDRLTAEASKEVYQSNR